MPEAIIGVLVSVILTFVLGLVAYVFRDSIRQAWISMREFVNSTKPRIRIRVLKLAVPGSSLGLDFSGMILEQNHLQNRYLFEIDEVQLSPTDADLQKLTKAETQRDFVDGIRNVVAGARGQSWNGVDSKIIKPDLKKHRDLIITNFPIPGRFYGWNSRDREALVISPVSVIQYFHQGKRPSLEEFVIVMAKRMAVFSVTPTIDPLRTHLETTKGCLFDFTEHLRLVRHVVEKPLICPDCMKDIGDYHGKSFASDVKKWVEGRKLSVPRPA